MDSHVVEDLLMPATYGRLLVRLFPPDALLADTGLTVADFAEPDRRITVRQALQYIRNTLTLAEEPDWYMSWINTLTERFHGPVGFALWSAPTLGEGLDVFLRYFSARLPYLHLQGRVQGEHFIAEICPLIELGVATPLLIETPLLVLQQYLHTAYGVDCRALLVELNYPPTAYAARYARHFKGPIHFNAGRNALVLPKVWRNLRNLEYHESTWSHALQQCASLASSAERTTLGELRDYLCRAFDVVDRGRALPTLEAAASGLHLTPRTLIRRLRVVGTTYQATIDEFLRARACELLRNEGIQIKEVAAALGFQSAANFGKAFKRWQGISPGGWRSGRALDWVAEAEVCPPVEAAFDDQRTGQMSPASCTGSQLTDTPAMDEAVRNTPTCWSTFWTTMMDAPEMGSSGKNHPDQHPEPIQPQKKCHYYSELFQILTSDQLISPQRSADETGSWELGAGSWELGAGSWERPTRPTRLTRPTRPTRPPIRPGVALPVGRRRVSNPSGALSRRRCPGRDRQKNLRCNCAMNNGPPRHGKRGVTASKPAPARGQDLHRGNPFRQG